MTKVAHLADIHIRNTTRHAEFRTVFANLYSILRKQVVDEIVISGDVYHTKLQLSPEIVYVACDLFKNLGKIAPVSVILGNHDCSISTPDRLDNITPLIDIGAVDNVHVYEKTGLYESKTDPKLQYAVFSILDMNKHKKLRNQIVSLKRKRNDIKVVGLYHGMVTGGKLDSGTTISGTPMSTFDGCDVVMLGDIHRHQYLTSTAAYAGSLIQHNFGEDVEKGFITWNIGKEKITSKFIEVPSEYKFLTVHMDDVDKVLKKDNSLYMVRVIVDRYVGEDEKLKLVRKLSNSCKGYKLYYEIGDIDIKGTNKKVNKKQVVENINSARTYEGMVNLLKDYVEDDLEIKWNSNQWKICNSIVRDAYSDVYSTKNDANQTVDRWTILDVKYKNILSYGGKGDISLEQYDNSTVGIFGDNASGKSSFLDIISFAIFGKSPRIRKTTAANLINNRAKSGKTSILIEGVSGQMYRIDRMIARLRAHGRDTIRSTVDLYEIEDGEEQPVNSDNKHNTEDDIESLFGTYDDFLTINYLYQGSTTTLSDVTGSERKDVLSRIMQVNILYKILEYIKRKKDEVDEKVSEYKNQNLEHVLKEKTKELKEFDSARKKLNRKIASTEKKIKKIDEEIGNIEREAEESKKKNIIRESLNDQTKSIDKDIQTENLSIGRLLRKASLTRTPVDIKDIDKQADDINGLKTKEELNLRTILDNISVLNGQMSVVKSLHQNICSIKTNIDNTEKTLPCHDSNLYDNCDLRKSIYDVDYDGQIKDIQKKLKTMEKSKNRTSALANKYDKKISSINSVYSCMDKIKSLTSQREVYIDQLNSLGKVKIDNSKYVDSLGTRKSTLNSELKQYKTDLMSTSEGIGKITSIIEFVKQNIKSYNDNKVLLGVLEVLTKALHRDGIPLKLMAQIVPLINHHITEVLGDLVEFSLKLEMEGNNVGVYIVRDDRQYPLELGSGMEKTFSNIAVRSALYTISLIPTIRILLIDEVLGTLDSDNLESMHNLLVYLNSVGSKFGTVFLVSHIQSIKDMVDTSLNIYLDDDENSKIEVL